MITAIHACLLCVADARFPWTPPRPVLPVPTQPALAASPPVWAPDPQKAGLQVTHQWAILRSNPCFFLLWRCTYFDVSFHYIISGLWQFSSRVPSGSPERCPPRCLRAYQRASAHWPGAPGCRLYAFLSLSSSTLAL